MDDKLRDIQDSLDEIVAVQTEQHYTLVEHQRRSAANEARLHVMENMYQEFTQHMSQLKGGITAFKWIGGSLTVLLVVIQLMNLYKG